MQSIPIDETIEAIHQAIDRGAAFLAAWVINLFENTIAQVAILAAFQSIVAGQGGNAGTQALTVVVRSIALVPILLRRLRIDPALASGVIVTTITDVTGFALFLGLATLLIEWLD